MVDIGASTDFHPTPFIEENILPKLDDYKENKIAQLIISPPHSDHYTDIDLLDLSDEDSIFHPTLLTCPHDKLEDEAVNWKRIQVYPGTENKEKIYRESYRERTPPLQTIQYKSNCRIEDFEYGIFYIQPPICEYIYPNDDTK